MKKLILCSFTLAALIWAADTDLRFGTWKLDLSKSKLREPVPFQSLTMIIEPGEGQSAHFTFVRTAKDGQVTKREEMRTCDGKERPSNSPPGTMLTCEATGPRTGRTVWKRDGKTILEINGTTSADGKLRRNMVRGTDENGSFEEIRVWTKQ